MDWPALNQTSPYWAHAAGAADSIWDRAVGAVEKALIVQALADCNGVKLAAAERLVTANLRFVISYVKKYQGHGLDLSELVAIGNEGLLKAVRKFDPDQGVKFISYAVWWVRQAVLKALAEQTRSVRIPLNQNSQLIRLSRAETILGQVLKRDPTDHELGRLLEESPEQVRAAKQMSATEVSLDAPVDRSDREACTLGERFSGADGVEIEETTDVKLMRETIRQVFQRHLTPRERKILNLYYGLDEGAEAMTLEKIGALIADGPAEALERTEQAQPAILIASIALLALGSGLATPGMSTLLSRITSQEDQGGVMGNGNAYFLDALEKQTDAVFTADVGSPVIWAARYLHMNGAPSQLDLWDYKPQLQAHFDKDLPDSVRGGQRITTMTSGQARFPVAPSQFAFAQHGKSGTWVSELLPHTAGIADDLCVVRSMFTEAINHAPAVTFFGNSTCARAKPGP